MDLASLVAVSVVTVACSMLSLLLVNHKRVVFVALQIPRLSFTSRSMEQATVTSTTLTVIKESRSMRKKHSGNIYRYGKDLLKSSSYTGRRGPVAREWEKAWERMS